MQPLSIVGPECCSPAGAPSGGSPGRGGDTTGFDTILAAATAKGSSEHKVADQGSGENSNSRPSTAASSNADADGRSEVNGDTIEAAVVLAVIPPPVVSVCNAEAAATGGGTDSASGSMITANGIIARAAVTAPPALQGGRSGQTVTESAQPTHRAAAIQLEGAASENGSINPGQLADGEQQSPVAANYNLPSNRIAASAQTSNASEDVVSTRLQGIEAESSLAGSGIGNRDQAAAGQGRVVADLSGKAGSEATIAQNLPKPAAPASVENTNQGSQNRAAPAESEGLPPSAGKPNKTAGQDTAGRIISGSVSAATQETNSVTKAIYVEGQEADRISIGAATGTSAAREASAIAASRGTEAALSSKSDILNQILDHAAAMSVPRNTNMRVQLRPPELGWIDLRLGIKDGVLALQITTESAATRGLIETALPQLRQALQARDIQLGDLTLALNSGSGNLGGWAGNGMSTFESHGQPAGLWRRSSSIANRVDESPETVNINAERPESGSGRYLIDYRI